MKRIITKVIFLAIAGIVFVAGCEEENKIDTKKSRLIAAENMQLKKDLERCQKEIEKQKELLEKCLQEKKTTEEQLQKSSKDQKDQMGSLLTAVMEQNAKLREENEKLKARVQQLETIIQQLGKEPPKIEEPPAPQPL